MSRWNALLLAACVGCASCGLYSPTAQELQHDAHGHLVWAARTGDVAAIRTLAASGLNLDDSSSTSLAFIFPDFDHSAWTALQHAVAKDQVEAVRVLLEWGADPDARRDGATPLFIAATKKDLTLFQALLDAGADIDATKAWTETPAARDDGELWPVMADALARVQASRSPQEKPASTRATAASSGPSLTSP